MPCHSCGTGWYFWRSPHQRSLSESHMKVHPTCKSGSAGGVATGQAENEQVAFILFSLCANPYSSNPDAGCSVLKWPAEGDSDLRLIQSDVIKSHGLIPSYSFQWVSNLLSFLNPSRVSFIQQQAAILSCLKQFKSRPWWTWTSEWSPE